MPSMKTPEGGWVWDGRFPHCDHRIVHAPGECNICDEYSPMLQYIREMYNINYTGHHDIVNSRGEQMLPDPAEVARPLSIINRWGGNTAKTKEQLAAQELAFKEELAKYDSPEFQDEQKTDDSSTLQSN